jgi:arylsulfatase A-like enzyme
MSLPNIVLINVSEAGWHFGCYGVSSVKTPHVDRIACEGARFDHMYSTASISSPSRVSLMTGQHVQRHGMGELVKYQHPCAMLDHKHHLSFVLRDAGYSTALFGYQHEAFNMDDLGFDFRNRKALYNDDWQWGEELHPKEAYPIGVPPQAEAPAPETARDFAEYVDRHAGEPFYAQVGFSEAQGPFLWGGLEPGDPDRVVLPDYLSLSETNQDGLRQQVANFEASLERVDEAVGIILDALDRNGLAENTLVVLTSDHGPELPRAKWGMYENSHRVAFLVRWPSGPIKPGEVHSELVSQIDFVPTLKALTGIEVAHPCDGESFAALLRGDSWQRSGPAFAYNVYCRVYAARSERYRLIRSFAGKCFNKLSWKVDAEVPAVELYDHETDPEERINLAGDPNHADAFRAMDSALWDYLIAFEDRILKDDFEGAAADQCRRDFAEYRQGQVKGEVL